MREAGKFGTSFYYRHKGKSSANHASSMFHLDETIDHSETLGKRGIQDLGLRRSDCCPFCCVFRCVGGFCRALSGFVGLQLSLRGSK